MLLSWAGCLCNGDLPVGSAGTLWPLGCAWGSVQQPWSETTVGLGVFRRQLPSLGSVGGGSRALAGLGRMDFLRTGALPSLISAEAAPQQDCMQSRAP